MNKRFLRFASLLLIAVFIVSSSVFAEKGLDKKTADSIDRDLKQIMADWKVPGAAIAVIRDGRVVYSKGYGYRDYENKIKADSNTVFPIGSCSKAFTAMTAGFLVDEGKLNWERPIINYLPDFRMYDPVATKLTTVRDMLSHRTGLPTGAGELAVYIREYNRKDIYERLKYFKPDRSFRQSMEYCNMPFMVTGYLVGQLTDSTWEENVRKRIFRPLGMTNSSLTIDELLKVENRALPYILKDGKITRVPYDRIEALAPAGSINSNVHDVANWLIFQMNEGVFEGKRLASKAVMKKMHSPLIVAPHLTHIEGRFKEITDTCYGLGWVVNRYRGERLVWHVGTISGFRAAVGFMPEKKIGVVFLSNQQSGLARMVVPMVIYDHLLGYKGVNWNRRFLDFQKETDEKRAAAMKQAADKMNPDAKDSKPSHRLSDYQGRFTSPAFGEMVITEDGGKLNGKFSVHEFTLKHAYYDYFEIKAKPGAKTLNPLEGVMISFRTDAGGNVDALLLYLDENEFITYERKGDK